MGRQQRTIGGILKIDLGDGFHTYGRILPDAAYAFYDARTNTEIPDIQKIISKPILFITGVYDDTVTSGRWKKVGKLPIEDNLKVPPAAFIQDPLNPHQFRIYYKGEIRSVDKEECLGLERAAVWEPEHIEERIRDHYAGKPNMYVDRDRKVFLE